MSNPSLGLLIYLTSLRFRDILGNIPLIKKLVTLLPSRESNRGHWCVTPAGRKPEETESQGYRKPREACDAPISLLGITGSGYWVYWRKPSSKTATSTPVVTCLAGLKTWKPFWCKEFQGNSASWNLGIPIARMSQVCPYNIMEGLEHFVTVFYWIRVSNLRATLAKPT